MAKKKEQAQSGAQDREVPQTEKDAVSALLGLIDRAKTLSKDFVDTTLPKLRREVWGTSGADGKTTSRTNLIFASEATLLPHIYAKNPDISVAPTEAVGEDEYEKIKEFGKTAQVALNHVLIEEAKMKLRIKSAVRSAMATSVGWLKLSFQHDLVTKDPLILRRANDIQENIRRAEFLIGTLKSETDIATQNRMREELRLQLKTIMEGDEIKVFKGFVIDRVRTEDIAILDESIVEFDEYVDAKRLAHRVWFTDDDYKTTFGHKVPKGATEYAKPGVGQMTGDAGNTVDSTTLPGNQRQVYRAAWEVWDKTTNSVCVVCEGCQGYARPPMSIEHSPERWYPFYAIGFNHVEGRWRPISDTELLSKLQDEYNTTRTLFAEARKDARPVRLARKGGNLDDDDIKALQNRDVSDFILIGGNPSNPIKHDIDQLEGLAIDPEAYDVTLIRNDMDMMVGLSDASRANLIQAKTATEAEIMRQALMTRVAERQDHVEDVISTMALATLQIMLQAFDKNEIMQMVGQGAVWPEIADIETIFRKIRVAVKAGTSGKPNVLKERETWTSIMPIISDTMVKVAELRSAGHDDLADAQIELLKETFQRYDERIDVDRFIPRVSKDEQEKKRQQTLQQAQAAIEENVKIKEELTQCQQQLQLAQVDLKNAQAAAKDKAAEIEAKKAIDVAAAQAKAQADGQKQVQEIRSQEAVDIAKYEAEAAKADAEAAKSKDEHSLARHDMVLKMTADIVKTLITAHVKDAQPDTPAEPGKEGQPGKPAVKGKSVKEALGSFGDPAYLTKFIDNLARQLDITLTTLPADGEMPPAAQPIVAEPYQQDVIMNMQQQIGELARLVRAKRVATARRMPDGSIQGESSLAEQ